MHLLSYLCLMVVFVGRIHSNPLTNQESWVQLEHEKAKTEVVNEPQLLSYDSLQSLGLMSRSLLIALTKDLTETPPSTKFSLDGSSPFAKLFLTLFSKKGNNKEMLKFVEMLLHSKDGKSTTLWSAK